MCGVDFGLMFSGIGNLWNSALLLYIYTIIRKLKTYLIRKRADNVYSILVWLLGIGFGLVGVRLIIDILYNVDALPETNLKYRCLISGIQNGLESAMIIICGIYYSKYAKKNYQKYKCYYFFQAAYFAFIAIMNLDIVLTTPFMTEANGIICDIIVDIASDGITIIALLHLRAILQYKNREIQEFLNSESSSFAYNSEPYKPSLP